MNGINWIGRYYYQMILIACLFAPILIYGTFIAYSVVTSVCAMIHPEFLEYVLSFNPYHLFLWTIAIIHRIKFRKDKERILSCNTAVLFWTSFCVLHYFGLNLPFEFPIWCMLLFMTIVTTIQLLMEVLFY